MAGIQCCRKILVFNTSSLFIKNRPFLQSCRRKHHLLLRISPIRNKLIFPETKQLLYTRGSLSYRLASTEVTKPEELVSNINSTVIHTSVTNPQELKNEPPSIDNQAVHSNSAADLGVSLNTTIDESSLPPIPQIVPETPTFDFIATGLKEPSFESLGLGSYWPSGLIQQGLEYLHIQLDLPWWEVILIATIIHRSILFPLNVHNSKNQIHLNNHLPHLRDFQEKIRNASAQNDYYAVANHSKELEDYVKKNDVNFSFFLKQLFIQAPLFLSMYIALKGISYAPLESLKTGGLFWFEDLSQPDPYYILPGLLSTSILLLIELGIDSGISTSATKTPVKNFFRVIPVVTFFLIMKFPAFLTLYWFISNSLGIILSTLLKTAFCKKLFKIPNSIPPPKLNPTPNKGFIRGFKEGFENIKIAKKVEDRERMNMKAFEKAGSGPTIRTFKKNPMLLEKTKK